MVLKLTEFLDQLVVDFLEKNNTISVNWINRLFMNITLFLIDS